MSYPHIFRVNLTGSINPFLCISFCVSVSTTGGFKLLVCGVALHPVTLVTPTEIFGVYPYPASQISSNVAKYPLRFQPDFSRMRVNTFSVSR